MSEHENLKYYKPFSLILIKTENSYRLKHFMNLKSNSFWGLLFFLFAGFLYIFLSFQVGNSTGGKMLCYFFSILFIGLSIITLLRQEFDFVEIKDDILTYRYNLKKKNIKLKSTMNIKMKVDKNGRSKYFNLRFYLEDSKTETLIFNYLVSSKNYQEGINIGAGIKNSLNKLIHLNVQDNILVV